MKAIVVRQPWATLIALGVKAIETRPGPPNGPMRPDGVRGLPGCTLERGERIAIVAGGTHDPIPMPTMRVQRSKQYGAFRVERDGRRGYLLRAESLAWPYRLPLGAVVCTVTVDEALEMRRECGGSDHIALWDGDEDPGEDYAPAICRGGGEAILDLDIDGPLGDFTPGRWGWLLGDVQPCTPVPCKGKQGVFVLPDDVELAA